MTFIPEGYGEATLRWRAATTTRDATCVVGIRNAGDASPTTLAAAINTLCTGANGLGQASGMSSTWSWRGVRVVVERGSGPEIDEVIANTAGTLVADPIPPNGSILVQKRTALGGRRGRGRMFLPPVYFAESAVDSIGTISGAAITALQTRVSAFLTGMITADAQIYVLHSTSEVMPASVLTMPVQSMIATQRRRLRR